MVLGSGGQARVGAQAGCSLSFTGHIRHSGPGPSMSKCPTVGNRANGVEGYRAEGPTCGESCRLNWGVVGGWVQGLGSLVAEAEGLT